MPRSVGAVTIGDTESARRLYAGRYADILADTIDSQAAGCEEADVAFVVGALSFVGRVEEAELFLENHRCGKHPSIRMLAAGGFFVTVAHARSGDFARARRTLARAYRETAARRDAWSRAFLFQAIACCHYFTANYTRAARAALNAQASALEARFAYVQMLATDMRAHVLAQRGDLDEGLRLLEQARHHAQHLGFDVNVRVIEVSRDQFGQCLAAALFMIVFFQSFVNIGMNIGILPVTGITLPFISQGLSSVWAFLIAEGLLQSVLMRHRKLAFQNP